LAKLSDQDGTIILNCFQQVRSLCFCRRQQFLKDFLVQEATQRPSQHVNIAEIEEFYVSKLKTSLMPFLNSVISYEVIDERKEDYSDRERRAEKREG